MLVLLLLSTVGLCADAALLARRRGDAGRSRAYERWWVYAVVGGLIVGGWLGLFSAREEMLGYSLVRLPAPSMEPALRPGDWVLIDTWYCRGECEPERGLIVVVAVDPGGGPAGWWVKRIGGIGGDTLEMVNGVLRVNGEISAGPFSEPTTSQFRVGMTPMSFSPLRVPAGEIFLLGDNLERSLDSRVYGPIPSSSIRGRVTGVVWHTDLDRVAHRHR